MRRMSVLVSMALVLVACSLTTGSGTAVTEPRALTGFDSIDVSGAMEVQVAVGPAHAVVVEGDDNIVPLVRTRVQGSTLVIDTELGRTFSTSQPLIVSVTMPSLANVDVSGSGGVTVVGIQSESLDLAVSGSGSVSVTGVVTRLMIGVSGSGSVSAASLDADQAEVDVSGSGSVDVRARDTLNVRVTGSGSVEYFGEASVVSDVSGSGTVSRGG